MPRETVGLRVRKVFTRAEKTKFPSRVSGAWYGHSFKSGQGDWSYLGGNKILETYKKYCN